MNVDGPRFFAFLPLGSKIVLENDILFLMEAYNQPYDSIMAMPSSRRHRIVKAKEEITRQRNADGGGASSGESISTGLDPFPKQAGRRTIGLSYPQGEQQG